MRGKRLPSRNTYFDYLRGVAILMVVGIHTYSGNHELNRTLTECIQLIVINSFNCAVPLFLAISGYFIARKKLSTFSNISSFWKKQIPTVYIPCLIFSLPWLILHCVSIYYNGGGYLKAILNYFLCGYSVYYFIALIIECYILAPILVKYNNKKTLIIVIFVSILAIFGFDYVQYVMGLEYPLIIRGSFPPLLIFFYLGIFLSKHNRDYPLTIPIIMIVLGLIMGIIHMQYVREGYGVSATGQKISLYLFNVGVILFCLSKKAENAYKENIFTRLILWTGEISFGIYFTHVYVIFFADRHFPSLRENWLLLWSFSLLLTITVIIIVKRIAPNWSRRYLGYR